MSEARGEALANPPEQDRPEQKPTTLGHPFRLLWAGQSLSLMGDQVTLIALPLVAVHYLHAGTFDIGVLGACLRLPFLIVGLPAGVWVARAGLVRSMLAADMARAATCALVPALVIVGVPNISLLFAGALLLGVGTVFFQVAYQSVVPELVPDQRRWHAANTRLSLSDSMALLVGPALGGLIVASLSSASALGVDAATYAFSVASLTAIATRRRERSTPMPTNEERLPIWRQVSDGINYVRRNAVLNAIMWVGALYNLGSAMYDALIVVFAVRELHMSPTALGLAIGVGAIGFPIGSLVSKVANARFGMGPTLIVAAVPSVGGLLVTALAATSNPAPFLVTGTFLVGLGQGCFAVNAITLRQLTAASNMRAQATSVHRFVSWGALPIGSLAAGAIGQAFGLRTAMIAAGVTATLCFWPLLTSPLRFKDARPSPA